MEIGVYFPTHAEFPALAALGITYAVRPIVTPASGPNGEGFVSENYIYRTDTPSVIEAYGGDEVDDPTYGPARIQQAAAMTPQPAFVNISNGGWGCRDHLIPASLSRGLLNGGGDLISPLRCWWSALEAKKHWGTNWTVVLYASPHLRRSLRFYRRLGIARVFIWRFDTDATLIKQAL